MEVNATSKDVWTWQSLERELSPIRATTNRLHLRRYATLLHHGVDSIAFTVNEYGRGASTYYLPY